MSFLRKLFGPKEPEDQADKLIGELSFHSPDVADLKAERESFCKQYPAVGSIVFMMAGGAGWSVQDPAIASDIRKGQNIKRRLDEAQRKEENVRAQAALKLGRLGDARAVEALITALKDQYDSVRINAAKALGQIGDRAAIGPLTEGVQKKYQDDGVREAMAQALKLIEAAPKP